MGRATIDFGIDLGTTNSAITVVDDGRISIVKNNEGADCTPSAVLIEKSGEVIVGRHAKARAFRSPDNAAIEFKREMGEDTTKAFAHSGRLMRPEELSAEVLRSLRGDVRDRLGEEMLAAVITVPAAFDLPQNEATSRAAELAGLRTVELMQEPVAAGLAYGSQQEGERAFWLVYDLGGGTFDAAIIELRDGIISVVSHGGDQWLGGSLVDWAIVEQLFVPALAQEYDLPDLRRGNPRWVRPLAILKQAAEEAKIRLTRAKSVRMTHDETQRLCDDDKGRPVEFVYNLQREEVDGVMEPFLRRSVHIARRVMAEARLGPGDIEKLVLVGGPTLSPFLREMLADPTDGLGVPLDFSLDPLTAVAHGAAVYAGTRLVPYQHHEGPTPSGAYRVELQYEPQGPDNDFAVGGRVEGQCETGVGGFRIEFVNGTDQVGWRSGQIPLSDLGVFTAQLHAATGLPNRFAIELTDPTGARVEVEPAQISYTVGLGVANPPLTHSIGVAMANNEMGVFLRKGRELPARGRDALRTTAPLRKGDGESRVVIPIIEGDHVRRADRNRLIGRLTISGDQVRRDVPEGSAVNIVIEIDTSRRIKTRAYFPLLDEEYEEVVALAPPIPTSDALTGEFDREKQRLKEATKNVSDTGDVEATQLLRRIGAEDMEREVATALDASTADAAVVRQCQNRILDLRIAIDAVEDALEWPKLRMAALESVGDAKRAAAELGNGADRQRVEGLVAELEAALDTRDVDLLRRRMDQVDDVKREVLFRYPAFWGGLLEGLGGMVSETADPAAARQLLEEGRKAVAREDASSARNACQAFVRLLPRERQQSVGIGGDVIRL